MTSINFKNYQNTWTYHNNYPNDKQTYENMSKLQIINTNLILTYNEILLVLTKMAKLIFLVVMYFQDLEEFVITYALKGV